MICLLVPRSLLTFYLDLPGYIQAASQLLWMAINGGNKLMLEAPPHIPQKDDIPWLQRGSLHSCNFLVIIR